MLTPSVVSKIEVAGNGRYQGEEKLLMIKIMLNRYIGMMSEAVSLDADDRGRPSMQMLL